MYIVHSVPDKNQGLLTPPFSNIDKMPFHPIQVTDPTRSAQTSYFVHTKYV